MLVLVTHHFWHFCCDTTLRGVESVVGVTEDARTFGCLHVNVYSREGVYRVVELWHWALASRRKFWLPLFWAKNNRIQAGDSVLDLPNFDL